MNTQKSEKPGFLALAAGFIKWLGWVVYMVVGLALVMAVLFLVFYPLDYLIDVTDGLGWGAWGRALDGLGYISFVYFLVRQVAIDFEKVEPPAALYIYNPKLSASDGAELKRGEREHARKTRVGRWMEHGNNCGGMAGFFLPMLVWWPKLLGTFMPRAYIFIIQDTLFQIDRWLEEIVWDTWIFWILVLVPSVAFYLASVVFIARRGDKSRYVDFFPAALLLWIGVAFVTAISTSVAWIFFLLLLAGLAAVGTVLGREIGWISATLINGWEDRRAQAKITDTNSD